MKIKILTVTIIVMICLISTFSTELIPFKFNEKEHILYKQSKLISTRENSIDGLETNPAYNNTDLEKDLYLHYGRTNFTFLALENVESFNFIHAIPPNYENQAPILFNIRDGTTVNIIGCMMYNDTNYPNKIINFTVGPMKKKEKKQSFLNIGYLLKTQTTRIYLSM